MRAIMFPVRTAILIAVAFMIVVSALSEAALAVEGEGWGRSNNGWGGSNSGWGGRSNGGWGGGYSEGHRPWPSSESNEANIGGIIGSIIQGAAQAAQQQQQQPIYRPQYVQPQYVQPQYVQPQYVQPQYNTTPKKATVKANPKPVAKPAVVQMNLKPQLNGFTLATKTEMDLVDQVVEKAAKDDINQLETDLGQVAQKDPKVKQLLQDAKDAIASGKTLDPTWKDQLKTAVDNAVAADPTLAPGITAAQFDQQATDFIAANNANAALQQIGNAGLVGVLPVGTTSMVMMPVLGPNEVLISPNGNMIIMGTGGAGAISTTTVDAADALGLPLGVGDPEPDSKSDYTKQVNSGVLLMNPTDNEVNYVLANHNYSMKPGYTQKLGADRSWVIRFNRGEGLGEAEYTLSEGTYNFGYGDKGWELYQKTFSVTVDNTGNDQSFNYVADNTEVTLPPGGTKTTTSSFPIFLRFDRGDGGAEAVKKISEKNYHLKVGINPKDGLWDLYPQEDAPLIADGGPGLPTPPEKASSRVSRLKALLQASKQ